ncbi:MAG: acyltransferase [Deltaproteobacteria bacterium]|nr:acyltransferase [Deltaproteobacteria bacterium]
MRRDHRPYYLKRMSLRFREWYVEHFLRPQFTALGNGYTFMKPWYMEIFGWPIELGDFADVICTVDRRVRLTVWSEEKHPKGIHIGDHCLICPGVRISCAKEVTIGNDCMMASDVYITDSDWHSVYDRVEPLSTARPIRIGNNVWIGDGAIICKGVTIGDNSIVGTRAVVNKDVPPNTIAAGNPAVVVSRLDPGKTIRTRADWFADPDELFRQIRQIDRDMLRGNTILGWLRARFFPKPGD